MSLDKFEFRPGWLIQGEKNIQPDKYTLHAVGVLVSADHNESAPVLVDKSKEWYIFNGLRVRLTDLTIAWDRKQFRPVRERSQSSEDEKMKPLPKDSDRRVEHLVGQILADKVAAEQQYPDKEMREGVLPMLRRIREEYQEDPATATNQPDKAPP